MSEEIAIKFPVYVLTDPKQKLPDKGIYYVVTGSGIFLRKENFIGSALVKVDRIPSLPSVETQINLRLPKIPARIIAQAHYFFKLIFDKLHSECGVIIFYSKEKQDYLLWCPKQQVSYGGFTYDRNDEAADVAGETQGLDGYHQVGTIHSHCNFNAFHSGTDTADESDFDGIHITLGDCDRSPNFSMVASVAINNNRVEMEPEHTTEDLVRVTNEAKKSWMSLERQNFFTVNLSEEDQELFEEDKKMIKEIWVPKVEKSVWFGSKKKGGGGSEYGYGGYGYGGFFG